jgi:photosystem II stability/assembly factor-like uncharacterized protein
MGWPFLTVGPSFCLKAFPKRAAFRPFQHSRRPAFAGKDCMTLSNMLSPLYLRQRRTLPVRVAMRLATTLLIACPGSALHAQATHAAPARTAAPASSILSKAWTAIGPDGGDARSLAADPSNPRHLYLGTTSSWVYETKDGGANWERIAKLAPANDLIIDNLVVDESDPKTVFAGVWKVDERGGGLFVSHDAGRSWSVVAAMDGQSIRAIAQAPSNAKIFVAGTLAGVFRSTDSGEHWAEMSPAGSTEIHEVESIAIDPTDPGTVYAGTWHLPWKTTDGGAHWSNIKEGLIDDSDVFSIIIDPHTPAVVYASACSGIYKSDSAGSLFHKVQGIPSTARRTRVLMQDPKDPSVVYAGTTEGLYKTADAGKDWSRLTGADVIVNDVYVDPSNDQRLLLATDRSGVLTSDDGGKTFNSANRGFSQRLVQTILVDAKKPGTLYVGVLNDKVYGGAFVTSDAGATWQQQSDGLEGRDIFTLAQAPDGAVYAGTNNGILRLRDGKWESIGDKVVFDSHKVTVRERRKRVTHTVQTSKKDGRIVGRIHALQIGEGSWFAAASSGVYRSTDSGANWTASALPSGEYQYVSSYGVNVFAAQRNSLMVSIDGGETWKPSTLPSGLSGISALTTSPDGVVWIGGRQGLYFSKDAGASWSQVEYLPLGEIDGLNYDPAISRVLVSSRAASTVFGVDAAGSAWKFWQTGWEVHQVAQAGDRFVAASLFDGVVMEPAEKVDIHGTLAAPSQR